MIYQYLLQYLPTLILVNSSKEIEISIILKNGNIFLEKVYRTIRIRIWLESMIRPFFFPLDLYIYF